MTGWKTGECLSSHLSLNHEGHLGTTDDFATSFLHFSLFCTAPWDLVNSRPVHSLMLSSTSSSDCLVFFPLSLCFARWFWPDLMNGRRCHTTAVCVSLRNKSLWISNGPHLVLTRDIICNHMRQKRVIWMLESGRNHCAFTRQGSAT